MDTLYCDVYLEDLTTPTPHQTTGSLTQPIIWLQSVIGTSEEHLTILPKRLLCYRDCDLTLTIN